MIHDQAARPKTVAQEHKPVLVLRMIRIVDQSSVLVQKSGLRFLEWDAALREV
jgi:hypothetical protein